MQIVSLTTDFGNKDHYVAVLKASILSRAMELRFVDISHKVGSHDIVQAALFLEHALEAFPKGSIHIVAVNNFYQKNYKIICFEQDGHYFIGPNNGVFSLIFDNIKTENIYEVQVNTIQTYELQEKIAHAVACIVHGLDVAEIGPCVTHFEEKLNIQPVITNDQIRATIIHIDHFHNAVINLKKKTFDEVCRGRAFSIYYKNNDPISYISQNYGDVPIGNVLCLFNPAAYLEIAINMGKAASLLNLNKNETIQINFHE